MDDQPSAATHNVDPGSQLTLRSDGGTSGPDHAHAGRGLAPGSTLGRYVLVERIGFGGMGEVYRAFDPELGRLVAIKHVLGDQVDESDQRRLQQEAMAIAQLSHPNVVQVYDVGRDAASRRVFIAMEYVEGETLRTWVEGKRAEEIIACYALAGRGLAAAHERGIVHRDFKPANVLVDGKGTPKVLDFGLAVPSGGRGIELSPAVSRDIEAAGRSSGSYALLRGLSGAAGRLGTPAYMSPEQFAGLDTDGRADQFSFAVALYEALHDSLPFAGKTLEAYACAVIDGDAEPPPRRADVPRHVSEALERALHPDPDQRFPDMDALLAQLEPAPTAATPKAWMALAAMAVVTAGGVAWGSSRARGQADARIAACQGAFAEAGANLDVDAIERTIAAADRPFARDLSTRASERLESVHGRWTELTRLECTSPATGSLGDARTLCLSRHGARERRLLEALHEPSAADLDHLIDAIVGLETHLDGCEDPSRLEALAPAAAIPAQQQEEILGALERVELARLLGRYGEAKAQLEDVGDAHESWPVALRYDWLVQAMHVEMEAGSTRAAAALFDDHLSALVAGGLDPVRQRELDFELALLRMYEDDHEASDRAFRRYHEACLEALGPDHRETILAKASLGHAPDSTGRYELAHELYVEADDAGRRAGLHVVDRMTLRSNVALSAAHLGDLELAREAYEDVLAWSIEEYGEQHPHTENARFDVAYTLLRAGDGQRAAAMFRRWLERKRSDPSWDSPLDEVSALGNLGAAHLVAGEVDEAEAALREALELARATHGEDASQQAMSLGANLGALLDGRGRHDDAVVVLAGAVAMADEAGTAGSHNGVMTRNNLAVAQAKAGDQQGAEGTIDRALTLALQSGSQELVALTRLRQARVALEAGDEQGAEAALQTIDDQPLDDPARARVEAEILRLELRPNQNKRDSEESP